MSNIKENVGDKIV